MPNSKVYCKVCDTPMVWSHWHRRNVCAVYGTHPADRHYSEDPDTLIIRRNYNAPLANVVDELDAMTLPTGRCNECGRTLPRAARADYACG
jgi:hypothetical protein